MSSPGPPRRPDGRLRFALVIAVVLVSSGALGPIAVAAEPGVDRGTVGHQTADTAGQTPWPAGTSSSALGSAASTTDPNASLVAAYPNPVARGDPGEFVVVNFPAATNGSGWAITDGITTARLPNRTFEGLVAFSTAPDDASAHTDHPVVGLEGRVQLADDGDRLAVQRDGAVVDETRYRRAPTSQIRDFEAGVWRPVGATALEPLEAGGGKATTFVLPDDPDATVETLEGADDRVFLGGYTLSSERVVEALLGAHARGVTVRVLLDGAPVGGVDRRQARLLDDLEAAGVEVSVLAGPHTRYGHHHPKYAVVDDRALVTTENFKPAGTGGMSSRGWGVVVSHPTVADGLAALHEADRTWRAATPWSTYREGRTFSDPEPALGAFERRHPTERHDLDAATLLVGPDNAADALEASIDDAERRVLVQQVSIDGRDNRLLRAAIRAAARGVAVRIHLSDAWYVEEDNAALVAWLDRRAEAEGWTLEARVDDADGYEKVHAKGVVVDDTVYLGSLNWGHASMTDNREVVVGLRGDEVAEYYASVFASDWAGEGDRSLPVGLFGAVAVATSGALLVARRVRFAGRDGVLADWRW